jgi:CubicO group peptidase (beta-lactamase class C family)
MRMIPTLLVAIVAACTPHGFDHNASSVAEPHADDDLLESTPEAEGVDSEALAGLTEWIRDDDVAIFSVLVSRHGRLVYELYTSNITRDDAHYLMSVTKSVTSALVGIALDRHELPSVDATVADLLPASLFASPEARARFMTVSLKDVLGMSALDAQVPPHLVNNETRSRLRAFEQAPNRTRFALTQALLPEPGRSFQYTDVTPLLASGALSYATHESVFDYAEAHLFGPLRFRNEEWMHEDASGVDNGAYGLRLRPTDMQKLGILYLDGGVWQGAQIMSREWVEQSFTPWIPSRPGHPRPNDGWYWWVFQFGGREWHVAEGWKGQLIAINVEQQVAVTMTGDIERDEDSVVRRVLTMAEDAVKADPLPAQPAAVARMRDEVRLLRASPRVPSSAEGRMVPSVAPKERHRPFAG